MSEYPKWVNGRIAKDARAEKVLERHAQDCGIHLTDIITPDPPAKPFLRDRRPPAGAPSDEYEPHCTCGVIPFNGADPAKFDHDDNGAPGGSKKRRQR